MTTDEHLDELIEQAEAVDFGLPWKRIAGYLALSLSTQTAQHIAAADPTLVAKMARLIKAQRAVIENPGDDFSREQARALYNNLFQEGE